MFFLLHAQCGAGLVWNGQNDGKGVDDDFDCCGQTLNYNEPTPFDKAVAIGLNKTCQELFGGGGDLLGGLIPGLGAAQPPHGTRDGTLGTD